MKQRALGTRFIGIDEVAFIVGRLGLPACLERLTAAVGAHFLRWQQFETCPRLASHSAQGVIELMPISDGRLYSFKYVNGHPLNGAMHGLPTVMAFGVLAEVSSGQPLLVSELTFTTALRTAATSVMAAQALARPGSRVMAVIGNGAQSEFQCLAFHHLMGIRALRLHDIDPAATAKLVRNLRRHVGNSELEIVCCSSVREAVKDADIVTTLTADKACATILTADMLQPGMHINAVGGDCPGKTELAADVLLDGRVFVEYEPQTRVEGDIQQLPADFEVTELWRVLGGQAPGRSGPHDITVFDSVGFALEDHAALCFMRDCANELGLSRTLPLIPALHDPKDLFAMVSSEAQTVHAPGIGTGLLT